MQISDNLNNKQLIQISKNLNGVTKSSNDNVFSMAEKLDTDSSASFEKPEVTVNNLITLGNRILHDIGNALGINIGPSENTEQTEGNFEDAKNDSIVENHFEPVLAEGREATNGDIKNSNFEGLITPETVEYTMNSIIQEKQAQGIGITERSEESVKFDDGSELSFNNGELIYTKQAADGTSVSARLEAYKSNDANGTSWNEGEATVVFNDETKNEVLGEKFHYGNQTRETDEDTSSTRFVTYNKDHYKKEDNVLHNLDSTISKTIIENEEER